MWPQWIVMVFLHTLAKTNFWLFCSLTDNSISVLAKHDTFRRQKQEMYFLPIIVTDNGNPPMSSTNTLTIRVCGCSKDGIVQSCNVEAYVLPIGLSMGALIAILACIVLLLGAYKKSAIGWISNFVNFLKKTTGRCKSCLLFHAKSILNKSPAIE